MEKPRIEQVLHAIDALYGNQSAEGKEAASKWLEDLQNSVGCLSLFCVFLVVSDVFGCRRVLRDACWLYSSVLQRKIIRCGRCL